MASDDSCCEAVVVGAEAAVAGVWAGEMVAVCQSVGSSSQTEDFRRILQVLICCVGFSCSRGN